MKNKRQLAKDETRAIILEKAKTLFLKNGIANTSTKQLSTYCNLAHGTLFVHFTTRENLIATLIHNELLRIGQQIHDMFEAGLPLQDLLKEYLSFVANEEDFFCILTREFSSFSKEVQHQILNTESITKKYLFEKIESGISSGKFKAVNPSIVISLFFGTLSHYLLRKEYMVESGSVIQQKSPDIIDTFMQLLMR